MKRYVAMVLLVGMLAGVFATIAMAASGVDFYPGDDPPKAAVAGGTCKDAPSHPPYNNKALKENPGNKCP